MTPVLHQQEGETIVVVVKEKSVGLSEKVDSAIKPDV
jgi:hypothetical protein